MAFSFSLLGQTVEPEMTADRPGFRNSTHLVGPGIAQIENGLSFSRDHVLYMEPELRIGTFRWLELRLKTESVVLRSPDEAGVAGISDLQAGVKFPVFNRIKNTRIVTVLKSTVPSGHGSQTTGGYEPGAELIWEHKLTEDFSFAGTWDLTRLKKEQFLWQRAASVSANNNFGKALRAFAELYVMSPKERGAGNDWTVDAGLMRVIGKLLMIDLAAGRTVHGPPDWFMALGFSVRTRVPYMRRSPF